MDLPVLPPRRQILFLHLSRVNTVNVLRKSSNKSVVNAYHVTRTGCEHNGNFQWIQEEYPSDVNELLIGIKKMIICTNENEQVNDTEDKEIRFQSKLC